MQYRWFHWRWVCRTLGWLSNVWICAHTCLVIRHCNQESKVKKTCADYDLAILRSYRYIPSYTKYNLVYTIFLWCWVGRTVGWLSNVWICVHTCPVIRHLNLESKVKNKVCWLWLGYTSFRPVYTKLYYVQLGIYWEIPPFTWNQAQAVLRARFVSAACLCTHLYKMSLDGVNLFCSSSLILGRYRPSMASVWVMLRVFFCTGTGRRERSLWICGKPLRYCTCRPSINLLIAPSITAASGPAEYSSSPRSWGHWLWSSSSGSQPSGSGAVEGWGIIESRCVPRNPAHNSISEYITVKIGIYQSVHSIYRYILIYTGLYILYTVYTGIY